jgi:hypothetical protein
MSTVHVASHKNCDVHSTAGKPSTPESLQALISPGAAADPAVQAARALGYWGHPPAARLAALLELCRDALDCWQLRWGTRVFRALAAVCPQGNRRSACCSTPPGSFHIVGPRTQVAISCAKLRLCRAQGCSLLEWR